MHFVPPVLPADRAAGTRLPRIPFPVWFHEKLGQKRNLHGMWKVQVKLQLSLSEVSHDEAGTARSPLLGPHSFSLFWHRNHLFCTCCPRPTAGVWLQTHRGGACTDVMATSPTAYIRYRQRAREHRKSRLGKKARFQGYESM